MFRRRLVVNMCNHPGQRDEIRDLFLRSLFAKLLPFLSCLQADLHNDEDVALISLSVLISSRIWRSCSRYIAVIVVLDDLESIEAEQIHDPWDVISKIALKGTALS